MTALELLVTDEMFPLPVAWDGRQVTWARQPLFEGHVFMCPPPPPERCSRCRTSTEPVVYRGTVHPRPGESRDGEILRARWRAGRIEPVREQIPARPVLELFCFRCPECGQDEVWQLSTGEWWTLGPEDYGPEGSVAPAGAAPRLDPW